MRDRNDREGAAGILWWQSDTTRTPRATFFGSPQETLAGHSRAPGYLANANLEQCDFTEGQKGRGNE
jgi:hypothetical protein